jgi:hypothetical protein
MRSNVFFHLCSTLSAKATYVRSFQQKIPKAHLLSILIETAADRIILTTPERPLFFPGDKRTPGSGLFASFQGCRLLQYAGKFRFWQAKQHNSVEIGRQFTINLVFFFTSISYKAVYELLQE